jgi:hypothetical protein
MNYDWIECGGIPTIVPSIECEDVECDDVIGYLPEDQEPSDREF